MGIFGRNESPEEKRQRAKDDAAIRKGQQEKIDRRNKAAQDSENAAIQRAEMQGDAEFTNDFLGLVHEVEFMPNDKFEKRLEELQKNHGDKGFFWIKPRKMTSKEKRIVAKAMKKPKRKKGWFFR